MTQRILSSQQLVSFREYLIREEKSAATQEKYLRDARSFCVYANGHDITKELVVAWKKQLVESGYAVRSVNSMLASINCLLEFLALPTCRVKNIRLQRQIYCTEDKELTKSEYLRLLSASKKNEQLNLVIQTICSTGIRVSEHCFITVEAARRGFAEVQLKGKQRRIYIPRRLCKALLTYAKENRIGTGSIFITATGRPLNRSNIWSMMKKLCQRAGVEESKVFPHNLRHLFARTYYAVQKDIVRLADILGHASINTTRIYTRESGEIHRQQIEKMQLLYIT